MSVLRKVLLVLSILEKNPDEALENLLNVDQSELDKIVCLLEETGLVSYLDGNRVLSRKGEQVLHYFDKMCGLDNSPLIKIR